MAIKFLDEEPASPAQQSGSIRFLDEEPSQPGRLLSAAGRYAQSLYSIPAGIMESIPVGGAAFQRLSQKAEGLPFVGGAFEFLNQLPGFREQVQPEERPLYKAGQAVRDFSADLFPYDPDKTGFFQSTLPSGAGSMVGFIGGGALGRAAKLPAYIGAATLGSTAGGSESFREATEAGADEDDIYFNTLVNAGLGLFEAVPISRLLNQINRSSGGVLKDAIVQGSEELVQEVLQQYGSNLAAISTFDPTRDDLSGLVEGGAAGFTLGSLASLVASAIGGRRARGFSPAGQPASSQQQGSIRFLDEVDQPQTTQPIQTLPEGEGALLGAPLQQEAQDALQQVPTESVPNVRQPEVPQEVQAQVPPAEGRQQAPQAPIEAEAAPPTGRAAMEERLRQLEAEEASQTAPQIVDPSPKIEELQSLKEPTVDDVRRLFPGSTNRRGGAYDLGDSLSSVEQLESLAKARESMTKGGDPFGRVMMGQFIREAIERATKSGSAGFQMTESAPLDFRQNQEVADWLVKNADRIGLSESAVTEIQQNMPPEGAGDMVTLYIGRGGVEGGGQGQSWATTNKQKAASFGTEVTEIQLTKSEAEKAKARARQAGQGGDTYFLTKEQFDKAPRSVSQVEAPVIEIDEPVLAPEQVLGVGFNPPAAGTSGLERRQAPPGQTLRGPVQEREITAPSRSSLGDYNYVVTTEKERADLADRIVEDSRQNFRNAYDRIRNIDDSAFRKVATAAVLSDQLERLSKANVADRLELEQHVRLLGSDLKAMKTEGGQALQAENQVNRIVGPYMAFLSYMDVIRIRLRDSIMASVDDSATPEQAGQQADALVASAQKQNQAEKTAKTILDQLATSQSDVQKWGTKKKNDVREAMRQFMNGDITADAFEARLDELKVSPATSSSLRNAAVREAQIRELQAAVRDIDGQRSRIAKELGANEGVAEKLLQLGLRAQMEKSDLKRKRIMEEAVDLIHREVDNGKIDPFDLMRDLWYGSVLMRIGTFANVVGGSYSAGMAFTLAAAVDTMARGKPAMAFRIIGQFLGGTYEGVKIAGRIIKTGDYTLLPDYERRAQALLSGKGRKDSLEILWKRGGVSGIFPGALAYTRRIMTGLDYIGALGTQDAQLLYSALTREDQKSVDALMRRFNKSANEQAEAQAVEEMGKGAPRIDVLTRKREILEEGVSEQVREAAIEVGRRAAANAEPRGIPGAAYRMVSKMPFYAKAPLGLAFMRAAMNIVANTSDWFPVLGLASYGRAQLVRIPKESKFAPMREFALDLPIEQQRMILAMQAMGLTATAAMAAMFLSGDDDDRQGVELSGSWLGISQKQRKALLDAGEKPNSIRFGTKGKWLSYKQVPFAGPLAIVGNMRDTQRFRGEKWDGQSVSEKITNGWLSGLTFIKDVSTLSGLTRIFGQGADQERFEELETNFQRMLADSVGRAATGFIPSLIKEIDQFSDPRLFRADKDKAMDFWLRTAPFARKLAGEGPDLNLFGEPVKLDRAPTKAWLGGGSDDPKWNVVSRLASQGVFPPVPGRTSTVVGFNGERRQMNAAEFYQYQKLWGQEFKAYIESVLPQLQTADAEVAKWHYDKFREQSQRIRRSVTPTE